MLHRIAPFCCLFVLAVLVAGGCQGKSPPKTTPVAAAVSNAALLSAEVCQDFAERMLANFASGDTAALAAAFDFNGLIDRATRGIDAPAETHEAFCRGFMNKAVAPPGYFGSLVAAVGTEGSYRFLRAHESGSGQRVLFRMIPQGGGVNYHDYLLERRPDGSVAAVDCYVYAMGEDLSDTVQHGYLAAVMQAQRGVWDKLTGKENAYAKCIPQLLEMQALIQQGKHREAIEVFNRMPEESRREKAILIQRLLAAQNVDDSAQVGALSDLEKNLANDPAWLLLAIDAFALRQMYPSVLNAIDRLDKALGGDPYLNSIRAEVYLKMGDLAEARRLAAQCVADEPTLTTPYWLAVNLAMQAEDYDDTLARLKQLDERFKMQFADLTQVPDYAGFVKSPQFQEWLKDHPPASAPAADEPAEPPVSAAP